MESDSQQIPSQPLDSVQMNSQDPTPITTETKTETLTD